MRSWVAFVLLATAAVARADGLDEVRQRGAAASQLAAARTQLESRRAGLEHESQRLAVEIEQLKAGSRVRQSLRLGELLAESRANADELDRVGADLKGKGRELEAARRSLVAACDRALAKGALAEAQRLELTRLRTAQVTLLAQPEARVDIAQASAETLDGPRELEEKADLLRDSEDKLRRETARLATRIDDVERRRHLRERANLVDEDWFSESASNRKSSQVAKSVGAGGLGREPPPGTTGPSMPPPTPGSSLSPPGGFPSHDLGGATTTLRNLVDPATLDELRRSDGGDDFDRQVRALKRAQSEIDGLAKELDRRARALSSRAAELKHKK